jgi:hypothetical protein
LGNGYVLNRAADFPWRPENEPQTAYSFCDIKDCETGDWVQIIYSEKEFDRETNMFLADRFPSERADEFLALISSPSSLESIATRAREFGFEPTIAAIYEGRPRREACRCRVFYPELRGDKDPYEA